MSVCLNFVMWRDCCYVTDKPAEMQCSIGGWATLTPVALHLAHINSKDTKNQLSQWILFKSSDETMTKDNWQNICKQGKRVFVRFFCEICRFSFITLRILGCHQVTAGPQYRLESGVTLLIWSINNSPYSNIWLFVYGYNCVSVHVKFL